MGKLRQGLMAIGLMVAGGYALADQLVKVTFIHDEPTKVRYYELCFVDSRNACRSKVHARQGSLELLPSWAVALRAKAVTKHEMGEWSETFKLPISDDIKAICTKEVK